jgi:hypothetical protein
VTSPPPPIGSMQLYDSIVPAIGSALYRFASTVAMNDNTSAVHYDWFEIGGSPLAFPTTEVISCHPPKNATGAFDEELPHVVLSRRTLPWERNGPGGQPPWLALLVFLDSEVSFTGGPANTTIPAPLFSMYASLTAAETTQTVSMVTVNDPSVLQAVLPTQQEISLLCHVRRVNVADSTLDNGDADGWLAVVVANRLPILPAGGPGHYHACLVSLEHRADLYTAQPLSNQLVLLNRWEFITDSNGTFDYLCTNLDVDTLGQAPATDVDGRVELAGVEREGAANTGLYRGPFTVSNAQAAADPADVSYDAAYELGRLMGAADASYTREIVEWHRSSLLQSQATVQNAKTLAAAARLNAGVEEIGEQQAHIHAAAAGINAILGGLAPAAPHRRIPDRTQPTLKGHQKKRGARHA